MLFQKSEDKVQKAFFQKLELKWNIFQINPALVRGLVLFLNVKKAPVKNGYTDLKRE